jgi:ABC-type transport system involved in multi-copper enzyme maturation permease subunit
MNVIRSVYHLMRADVFERIRRYSFLFVMGMTVYAGYLMVPSTESPYNAFVIGGYRGFYNSPWVGTVFGVVVSTLLTLIGFYLVKDAVNRDYFTRVGQIIATTPVTKSTYILGKWLSNLTLLTVILLVLTAMALIMQIVRNESGTPDLWELAVPIWFMGFPTLAIVAAMAVLFESIPFLRGGTGNVVYFFVWFLVLMSSVGPIFISVNTITSKNDFSGLSKTMVDIRQQLRDDGLDISHGTTDLGVPTRGRKVVRFLWDGRNWSAKIFLERSIWLVLALAIALSAIIPFDRFDPDFWRIVRQRKKKRAKQPIGMLQKLSGVMELSKPTGDKAGKFSNLDLASHLTPLEEQRTHRGFLPVLLAELRLMVRGQKWWWFIMALGIVIASLFSPLDVVRRYLFPAAWLWPILLWSEMGIREERYHTHQIVFSTPNPLRRQLLATWVAGFLMAIITGSGAGARFFLTGQWDHFFTWGIGAAFIPSLALTLGVWSCKSHLFEIVYLLWWYLGPIEQVPILDYMGITLQAITDGIPIIYFVASILLLGVAVVGRRRKLQV